MAVQKPPTIILNAVNIGPSSSGAFAGGTVDLTPWTDFTWASDITFTIHVSAINGSPTGGSLTAKFQFASPFTGGGQQFTSTRLYDLDTNQKASLIAEGEDWGTIASFNTATPVTVQRTIRGFGSRCNLHLDASSLSGGTSPTFTVTVVMSAKSGGGGSTGFKGSATGVAVPSVANYIGLVNNSGNLVGSGTTTRAINNGTSDTIQAAGMIGQYNSSAPTVTSGNWYVAQLDSAANLKVAQSASASGGYSYNHQSANGTVTIKSGAGTLHTVTVNNAGATDTITLYDNTAASGTVIAIIGSSSEATFTYDLAFTTGLTIVISGTTAPDVTFTYK